jgi:voltage-gated potassium channel
VNPQRIGGQRIGGQRIAAAALQPNVVEFLDVVMHDGSLEFRLEEVTVRASSQLPGRTFRDAKLSETTGACRRSAAVTEYSWPNPPTPTPIDAG